MNGKTTSESRGMVSEDYTATSAPLRFGQQNGRMEDGLMVSRPSLMVGLEETEKALECLHNKLLGLQDSLTPLLEPELTTKDGDACKGGYALRGESQAMVIDRILVLQGRIANIEHLVEETHARLQV